MKKFLSIMIALAMVLALMSVTAFADDSITLTLQNTGDQNTAQETYNVYKIFDVIKSSTATGNNADNTLGAGGTEGYNYTIATSSPWYDTIQSMSSYFTLTDIADDTTRKTVTLKAGVENTEATAKAIAAVLSAAAAAGPIAPDTTLTQTGTAVSDTTVDPGYYLIKSSAGANLVLATTNIAITEKNKYPTSNKTEDKQNMAHEDLITYTVTVSVPSSVDNDIVVNEKMSNVLKYTAGSYTVAATGAATVPPKANITESSQAAGTGEDAVFTLWTWTLAKADLIAMFTDDERAATTPTYKDVVFTFQAKMLDTAVEDTVYSNTVYIDYSNYETAPVTVNVKCFDFTLKKTDATGNDLTGAEFELRDGSNNPILFTKDGTTYNKVDGEVSGEGEAKIEAGQVKITGLAAGTYTLVETKAPEGYNKLSVNPTITIAADGTVTTTGGEVSGDVVTIKNNAGILFPSTGGMGDTILLIVGAILVIGSAVIFMARKKATATK